MCDSAVDSNNKKNKRVDRKTCLVFSRFERRLSIFVQLLAD